MTDRLNLEKPPGDFIPSSNLLITFLFLIYLCPNLSGQYIYHLSMKLKLNLPSLTSVSSVLLSGTP